MLLQNTILKSFNLFYTVPRLSQPEQPEQPTDLPRNVGRGQYLTPISVFLLAPAAEIA
jgi:hypothetical protein